MKRIESKQLYRLGFISALTLAGCLYFALGCAQASSKAEISRGGLATYYTTKSCQREGTSGVYTANGETYQEAGLTCALPSHAFGGRYQVCRSDDPSRCVIVRHNDYGPGKGPRARGVVVDLTPTDFAMLYPLRVGKGAVTVQRVGE